MKAKLDRARQNVIVKALKQGYSITQLKQAIDGCSRSAFHMGKNDSNQRYDDISLILRDSKHIEDFINLDDSDGSGLNNTNYSALDGAI